jgi:hypothetical protein
MISVDIEKFKWDRDDHLLTIDADVFCLGGYPQAITIIGRSKRVVFDYKRTVIDDDHPLGNRHIYVPEDPFVEVIVAVLLS